MGAEIDPLAGPIPEEVPLETTPLVGVIAQVRFPPVLSINRPDFVAPFQETIRQTYPIMEQQQTQARAIAEPNQAAPETPQIMWKFSDVADEWMASLAPDFLALTTKAYESRSGFVERFRVVVEALDEHIQPSGIDRLGVRYIDRITGDTLDKITVLIRREMIGIIGTPTQQHIQRSLSQTLFELPGVQEKLQVRWGQVPAGVTAELGLIEPADSPSWVLDTDMFSTEQRPFDVSRLIEDVRRYAERTYAFFRWAVTDEFLRYYGGKK